MQGIAVVRVTDPDVDELRLHENVAMDTALHPLRQHSSGVQGASGQYLVPAQGVAGLPHPILGAGAIGADAAEEVVGRHVLAVATGNLHQTLIYDQRRQAQTGPLLVDEFHQLTLQI